MCEGSRRWRCCVSRSYPFPIPHSPFPGACMRSIDAQTDTALSASHVPMLVLAELDFPSGFLRLNNSGQNFDWDGKTWYAGGALLDVSDVSESSDLEAHGITCVLNG